MPGKLPTNSQFDPELFDRIPIGLLRVDKAFNVIECNAFVKKLLPVEIEANLLALLHPDFKDMFESDSPFPVGEVQVQFIVEVGTIYTTLRRLEHLEDEGAIFTLRDTSEQVALSAQLKQNRQPERKFFHDINNLLTTTIGYSELINMMLEENEIISGERLTAIRRYHNEVFDSLKRADDVLRQQKQAGAQAMPVAIPLNRKHVMIVDDESQLTDFLSELLRARHYTVSTFNHSDAALAHVKNNQNDVDLVLLDQLMPDMAGDDFAKALLAINTQLPIVLCTVDESQSEPVMALPNVQRSITKPLDINELAKLVSDLID